MCFSSRNEICFHLWIHRRVVAFQCTMVHLTVWSFLFVLAFMVFTESRSFICPGHYHRGEARTVAQHVQMLLSILASHIRASVWVPDGSMLLYMEEEQMMEQVLDPCYPYGQLRCRLWLGTAWYFNHLGKSVRRWKSLFSVSPSLWNLSFQRNSYFLKPWRKHIN